MCRRPEASRLHAFTPLAFGFLTGKHRKGRPIDLEAGRAAIRPAFFDPAIAENAAKLDAVGQLVELATSIGCTLPQLAVAFTVAHPAVTSAIIGPRTMEQLESLLQGAPVTLDDAALDRIDEIVRPGTNLYNPAASLPPRSLIEPALRRRPDARERGPGGPGKIRPSWSPGNGLGRWPADCSGASMALFTSLGFWHRSWGAAAEGDDVVPLRGHDPWLPDLNAHLVASAHDW